MKKTYIFITSLLVIFFLGAGCSGEQQNSVPTKPAQSTQNSGVENAEMENTQIEKPSSQELVLTAIAIGNNAVDFEWKVGDEAANSSEGWRILYGTEPNPIYPSTWWFERSKPHRQKLWSGLPAGHAYFRLCQVIGDACMIYSNTVEVDIPGEGLTTSSTKQEIKKSDENIDAEVQEQLSYR